MLALDTSLDVLVARVSTRISRLLVYSVNAHYSVKTCLDLREYEIVPRDHHGGPHGGGMLVVLRLRTGYGTSSSDVTRYSIQYHAGTDHVCFFSVYQTHRHVPVLCVILCRPVCNCSLIFVPVDDTKLAPRSVHKPVLHSSLSEVLTKHHGGENIVYVFAGLLFTLRLVVRVDAPCHGQTPWLPRQTPCPSPHSPMPPGENNSHSG